MNEFTEKSAINAQKNAIVLSEIGLYNQQVKDFLAKNKLTPIVQMTIKNFNDSATRRRLTNAQYNKEVENFNQSHNGFYLAKKGREYASAQKYYSYINYPYLDREALKTSMDNYRRYVVAYNTKADEENEEIRKYNNTIVLKTFELSKAQKKRKISFKKDHNYLFAREYNTLVEENNAKTALFPKRTIPKIKYNSELIFYVLLGFYVSQLKTRNAYLMNLNRPTSTPKNTLPKLDIDHRRLATHKIDGITRLDICKKTAQNHIKRLREAGVLINYVKINQNKPIQVNFNPKILAILDGNPPKSQNPENKAFSPLNGKLLHDSKDTTRTFLKEKEIKDFANSKSLGKCGSILEVNESNGVCLADSYENTKGINKKNELGRAKIEKLGKYEILTQNFLARKLDERDFAQKLANKEFDNYKGLRYDYLFKIANYAHVNREDFKKIVIQDFIKSSAKIWKNHSVFEGEWKKTTNRLNENLFAGIVNKETIIQKLREYRWKLEFARKWFIKKNEISALFPYQYFDTNRTKSFEIGFYGLHSIWKKHLRYKAEKQKEQKRLEHEGAGRKRKHSVQKKITRAIHKYETGKYTYEQLYQYVKTNLPHEYLLALPNLINKQTINLA